MERVEYTQVLFSYDTQHLGDILDYLRDHGFLYGGSGWPRKIVDRELSVFVGTISDTQVHTRKGSRLEDALNLYVEV